jgi:hypothetical protein
VDQELLVDNRFADGEKLLAALARAGFDVAVAFWVLTTEDHVWLLYIASDAVDPASVGDAYRLIYTSLTQIPHASVSLSDVKVVHPSNPIARDAIAWRNRNPARLPVPYHGKNLGDVPIEEAYIYPKIGPMTRDEVLQTVMALLKRGGRKQPLTVTFADGKTRQAIPIGIQLQMQGPVLQIVLLDPGTGQSQAVAADEVINIQ